MSDIGRARGGWVQAQNTGLLACTGEATSRKVGGAVLSGRTSTHGCTVAASTSPTECAGTAQLLSAVERSHVRCLTKLAGLTWERTFLSMMSNCSCTQAHRSSCFSANFSFHSAALAQILPISLAITSSSLAFCSQCSQSSSCSSWDFAWVTTCSCLKAKLKSIPSLVCELSSLLVWRGGSGAEGSTREDKWWSSTELSHSASLVIGVTISSSPSFFLGRMTWVAEYRSSQGWCSHENGNQMVQIPSDRVATSRKGRPMDPWGK